MAGLFKSGFLALLSPVVQDGLKESAKLAVKAAAVADPTLMVPGFIAISLVAKGVESLYGKVKDSQKPSTIHRHFFAVLAAVLADLKKDAAGRFLDDEDQILGLWEEIVSSAASNDVWADRLAATELPRTLILDWVIERDKPQAHWPAIQHVLESWTAAARWHRLNANLDPPIALFPHQPIAVSDGFLAYLKAELPARWFQAIAKAATSDDKQNLFRQLSLHLQTRIAAKVDRLHAHAFDPPKLTSVEMLEGRIANRLVDLLRPQHPQALPLTGRDTDRAALQDWLYSADPVSIRCIVGQGGSGKTRIAIDLLRRISPAWQAGFVESKSFDSFLDKANFREWEWTQPTLLIFDYAAAQVSKLETLVADLRDRNAEDLPPLRILLLERVASETEGWYARLAGPLIEGADKLFHPVTPQTLSPLNANTDRRELLRLAIAACASFEGKPAPSLPVIGTNATFDRDLSSDRFADPLVLTMAGFQAVESGWAALALGRTDLADKMAEHETRRIIGFKSALIPEQLLLALAAASIVSKGIDEIDLLKVIQEESSASGYAVPSPGELRDLLLSSIVPGREATTPIEPDIIGEAFVLSLAKQRPERIEALLLRAAKREAKPAIEFLLRLVQDYWFRTEPFTWLSAFVAYGLASDLTLPYQIEMAIPNPCPVGLRPKAVEITELLRSRIKPPDSASDPSAPEYARLLNNLANRQSEVGKRDEALATAEAAARLWHMLAEWNRQAFFGHLAGALANLANRQSEAGKRREALVTAEEALCIYRQLVGRSRQAFLADLGMALSNLSTIQGSAGNREEALATAVQSVDAYAELTETHRAEFLPNFASSLVNLAARQRDVGKCDLALKTAERAVKLCTELVGRSRESFLPVLAVALNNLASIQGALGERGESLSTAFEAVRIYRELTSRNRKAFLPNLAGSISNLAMAQSATGDFQKAIAMAAEAVELRRELACENREAFLPGLADSINNLASVQISVQDWDEAIVTTGEAVKLRRELAELNREAFLPDLAMSLGAISQVHAGCGEHGLAQAKLHEALTLIVPFFEQQPQALSPLTLKLAQNYIHSCDQTKQLTDEILLARIVAKYPPQ